MSTIATAKMSWRACSSSRSRMAATTGSSSSASASPGSDGTQRGTILTPNLPTIRTSGQQIFFRYRTDTTAAGTTFADGESLARRAAGLLLQRTAGLADRIRRRIAGRPPRPADRSNRVVGVAADRDVGPDRRERQLSRRRAEAPVRYKSGSLGAFELTGRYHVLDDRRQSLPGVRESGDGGALRESVGRGRELVSEPSCQDSG